MNFEIKETDTAACEQEREESVRSRTSTLHTDVEEGTTACYTAAAEKIEEKTCEFLTRQSEHWMKFSWDYSMTSQNWVHAVDFMAYDELRSADSSVTTASYKH